MINTAEIQERMKQHKLTCGQIAIALSERGQRVTEREVRGIVFGEIVPSYDHLVWISTLLECAPSQLITSERRYI